ncbi:MAG: GNAT family N-acetyltransferase [Casimicrobiaceae bacterium]
MTECELVAYDEPGRFLAAAATFLRTSEVENSVIVLPAERMVASPQDDDVGCYWATVSAHGVVVAAAFHASVGGVLITSSPAWACTLIAADIAARARTPNSVVGPLGSCEGFARAWREHTGQAHALRFHLRHFELTQPPPIFVASGSARLPRECEEERLVNWTLAFVAEIELPEPPEHTRRRALTRIGRGQVRIWDDAGPVAYAGYGADASDTVRIAPVYTPPEFRGKGYASALVADLSRELFARGKRAIFLTTDVANPTSNSIYQRIGYRPVADHYHFSLLPATA